MHMDDIMKKNLGMILPVLMPDAAFLAWNELSCKLEMRRVDYCSITVASSVLFASFETISC